MMPVASKLPVPTASSWVEVAVVTTLLFKSTFAG